jgi:hypothetical protein
MSDLNSYLTQEQIDAMINATSGQGMLPGNTAPTTGGPAPNTQGVINPTPPTPNFDVNDPTTWTPSDTTTPKAPDSTNPPVVTGNNADPILTANHNLITNPTMSSNAMYNPTMQSVKPGETLTASNYTQGATTPVVAKTGTAATTTAPKATEAASYQAQTIGNNAPQVTAQEGQVGANSLVTAQQQNGLSPELEKTLSDFKSELAAIGLDPNETTQGQYSKLMDFGPDEIPKWAKGAYRVAQADMARRGIAGSTLAGEAITTALLQAAMPIATQDAAALQTLKLTKLDKQSQAVFLRAGFISQLDTQNLNNRQQAAVVNANTFLAMDMKNLDNRQQAAIINTQSRLQALLSDQSAVNTAQQFNAKSKQEIETFYADLGARVDMANTAQKNAMEQQNITETNTATRFNAAMEDERSKFNINNAIQIDQANANYLRNINTANTALVNQANYVNSQNLLQISSTAMANEFQAWRDSAAFLHDSVEGDANRAANSAALATRGQLYLQGLSAEQKSAFFSGLGSFASNIASSAFQRWIDIKFPAPVKPK